MEGFTCLQVISANGRLCLEGGVAHSKVVRLKAYLQMLGVSPAQPYNQRYPDHGILNDTSAMEHADVLKVNGRCQYHRSPRCTKLNGV
jgi:hypothetical protein